MSTLPKTPGVYIEEIPKFPPSIAPVETAIPAFIGYTEKADKIKAGDLHNKPTKIGSLAEYELYFGVGAKLTIDEVQLNDKKSFQSAKISNQFYMYDSLRLFYANGGGDCYIVSTGTYDSAGKIATDFTGSGKGLDTLWKVDEPTILVFPDNSLLGTQYKDVCDAALAQCGKLMDRVALLHVNMDDPKGEDFRSKTGINDLKYGMAYSPWLEVSFSKNTTYRDFKDKIKIGSTTYPLSGLTDDVGIVTLLTGYDNVITDVDAVNTSNKNLSNPNSSLRDQFVALKGAYQSAPSDATKGEALMAIMNFLFEIARKVDALVGSVTNAELKTAFKNLITSTLADLYKTAISYDLELVGKAATGAYTTRQFDLATATAPTATEWNSIFNKTKYNGTTDPVTASSIITTESTNSAKMAAMLPKIEALFDNINNAWLDKVVGTAQKMETTKHDTLAATFPLYKTILTGLQNASTCVPPSGAVAGIYAYVDRTRGVWKAPANVSLSGIVGPKDTFTASELDALNVDVNSGKSINAIRSFTGKGTLVYGARTLAGNDNEWRYVSVRRFFNFVEESTKKATEQFVFEPNDANTWVRIQAMIENFLTVLWRQGALQGIKPEHAFYVAVGLGKTMTPLDILEGRLIVEIGMAAVRPAEFIILKFSHKMAES